MMMMMMMIRWYLNQSSPFPWNFHFLFFSQLEVMTKDYNLLFTIPVLLKLRVFRCLVEESSPWCVSVLASKCYNSWLEWISAKVERRSRWHCWHEFSTKIFLFESFPKLKLLVFISAVGGCFLLHGAFYTTSLLNACELICFLPFWLMWVLRNHPQLILGSTFHGEAESNFDFFSGSLGFVKLTPPSSLTFSWLENHHDSRRYIDSKKHGFPASHVLQIGFPIRKIAKNGRHRKVTRFVNEPMGLLLFVAETRVAIRFGWIGFMGWSIALKLGVCRCLFDLFWLWLCWMQVLF